VTSYNLPLGPHRHGVDQESDGRYIWCALDVSEEMLARVADSGALLLQTAQLLARYLDDSVNEAKWDGDVPHTPAAPTMLSLVLSQRMEPSK
jgi:hypothetical protein